MFKVLWNENWLCDWFWILLFSDRFNESSWILCPSVWQVDPEVDQSQDRSSVWKLWPRQAKMSERYPVYCYTNISYVSCAHMCSEDISMTLFIIYNHLSAPTMYHYAKMITKYTCSEILLCEYSSRTPIQVQYPRTRKWKSDDILPWSPCRWSGEKGGNSDRDDWGIQ